jgi:hypothetical protein
MAFSSHWLGNSAQIFVARRRWLVRFGAIPKLVHHGQQCLRRRFAQPRADLNRIQALSPSQVHNFMDCQMRWWFEYGLKIPDLATTNMALDRAVHSALGENFAQKVDTREDLPTEGAVASFLEAWRIARYEIHGPDPPQSSSRSKVKSPESKSEVGSIS